jgi:hypothetical protein
MKNYKFKENEVIHCENEYATIKAKDILMEANKQMKTKEEVIEYFKDAKIVRDGDGDIVDLSKVDIKKLYHNDIAWYIDGDRGCPVRLQVLEYKVDTQNGWAEILETKESNKDKSERLRTELQEVEKAIKKDNEFKVGDIVCNKNTPKKFIGVVSEIKDYIVFYKGCDRIEDVRKATQSEIEEYNRPKLNIGDVIVKEWKNGEVDMFPLEKIKGPFLYGNPYLYNNNDICIDEEQESGNLKDSRCTLRTATKEETEHFHARVKELSKSKLLDIDGYKAEITKSHINYGCRKISKKILRKMKEIGISEITVNYNNDKIIIGGKPLYDIYKAAEK